MPWHAIPATNLASAKYIAGTHDKQLLGQPALPQGRVDSYDIKSDYTIYGEGSPERPLQPSVDHIPSRRRSSALFWVARRAAAALKLPVPRQPTARVSTTTTSSRLPSSPRGASALPIYATRHSRRTTATNDATSSWASRETALTARITRLTSSGQVAFQVSNIAGNGENGTGQPPDRLLAVSCHGCELSPTSTSRTTGRRCSATTH